MDFGAVFKEFCDGKVDAEELLQRGVFLPLLAAAQAPLRNLSLSPLPNQDDKMLQEADSALILLQALASTAVATLASHGYTIPDPQESDLSFVPPLYMSSTNESLHFPPEIPCKFPQSMQLLLELPFLISPFVHQDQIIWPVKVQFHSGDLAVLDIVEYNEELSISRIMVIGEYIGSDTFRDSEFCIEDGPGTHLESFYSCLVATISILAMPRTPVLNIGLGGGSIPMFLQKYTGSKIRAIEKRQDVIDAAVSYFGVEGFDISCCDALDYVENCGEKYSVVILDVYSGGEFPTALATSAFFSKLSKIVAKSESDSGVLLVNANSTHELHRILQKSFPCIMPFHDENDDNIVYVCSFFELNISPVAWNNCIERLNVNGNLPDIPFEVKYVTNTNGKYHMKWDMNSSMTSKPDNSHVILMDKNDASFSIFD